MVKLAQRLNMIRRVVARVASEVTTMEFASPEALKEYLHEHPGADPNNHTVKDQKSDSKPTEVVKPKPGDKVVITEGPHKGKTVTVQHLGPKRNGVPHMNVKPPPGENGPYGWSEAMSIPQSWVKKAP
jgi:transcription antitermination factor NusG